MTPYTNWSVSRNTVLMYAFVHVLALHSFPFRVSCKPFPEADHVGPEAKSEKLKC
jgi:hypothetical protein